MPGLSINSKTFPYNQNKNSFHDRDEIVNLKSNATPVNFDEPYLILIFVDFGLQLGLH